MLKLKVNDDGMKLDKRGTPEDIVAEEISAAVFLIQNASRISKIPEDRLIEFFVKNFEGLSKSLDKEFETQELEETV